MWTCPEQEPGTGLNYTIFAMVTDADGHQEWGYTIVTVLGERITCADESTIPMELLGQQVGVEF